MRGASKTLVAVLATLLLTLGLAACGGGDSSSSTTAEAGGKGQAEGQSSGPASGQGGSKSGDAAGSAGSGGGEGKSGGGAGSDSSGNANFVPKHHDDSGGGSEQYRVNGGDNSVQEYGNEAPRPELDAAAVALHDFLDARAEGNWAAACDYMAKSVIRSFEQLAAQAKQAEATDCGALLEKLTNPAAAQSMKEEAAQANVGSLRIEGGNAFVIYNGVGGTILAMPMADEGGTWKVASFAGTPLN